MLEDIRATMIFGDSSEMMDGHTRKFYPILKSLSETKMEAQNFMDQMVS